MLLAIDAGNTQTVFGLYAGGTDDLLDHWRIATEASRTSDELAVMLQGFLSFHSLPRRHRRHRRSSRGSAASPPACGSWPTATSTSTRV